MPNHVDYNRKYSAQETIQIYTDWANYYLERAKSKKKVIDLSADCRDGLLLADVIEAVTSFKVPDLVKKPKNQQQMYDNVNSCLNVLRAQAVGGLDTITTNDICSGRLKAVLALFFALSRFKQQSKQSKSLTGSIKAEIHHQPTSAVEKSLLNGPIKTPAVNSTSTTATTATTKITPNANVVVSTTTANAVGIVNKQQQQQHAQSVQNGNDTMTNRQIPTAYSKANGGTAIPLPATVLVQRRCPPDKVRPLPPTPNHTPSIPGLTKNGTSDFNSSSRPGSPPTTNHTIQTIKSVAGNNNGLRAPTLGKSQQPLPTSGIPPPAAVHNGPTSIGPTKHSMLDKLKLFNKEKQTSQQLAVSSNKSQASKRTSSSSGFSSARSERSDSSLSLNDGHISQIKPPTVSVTSANRSKDSSAGSKSTKQSKLLAASAAQKNAVSSAKTKLDKKEKSPARSLNKDGDDGCGIKSGHSSIGRGGQKSLPRGSSSDHKSSKTSSKTSLNSRSESKSSLIMPPSKSSIISSSSPATTTLPGGCTAIPKPVAAIKGTSKPPPPPPTQQQDNKTIRKGDILKREKSDISGHSISSASIDARHLHQQQNHLEQLQRGHQNHIIKPVAILPEPGSKPPFYANNISSNILGSIHSNSTNTGTVTTNSDANIIYRSAAAASTEPTYILSPNSRLPPPPAQTQKNPIPNRKTDFRDSQQSAMLSSQRHQQQQQMMRNLNAQQNASSKFHTIPSKIVGTIYEEDKPVSVLPMRPLLRGYNSHVTLPTRGTRGHHYIADFCESDIGQGYCSDGDALRITSRISNGHSSSSSSRFADIDNGYLSEGGGSSSHGKHFLNMMRARTQLPTTIEERISNRTSGKLIDGSLSDTQTYAEVKPEYSTYAMWLKHSNTAGSRLSEGDSMENLQIGSPGMTRHGHKMIHRNAGAGVGSAGTNSGGGAGGNESPYIQSPRLNRSNSIRSTKSEKMYPSMLSRGPDVEIEPYYCLPVGTVPPGTNGVGVSAGGHLVGGAHPHGSTLVSGVPGAAVGPSGAPVAWSQPTSPTPLNRGFGGPLSPTHAGGTATLPGGCYRLTYPKKNDEVHGSAASLLSGGSSLYGSAEERQANEIRRLKRELIDARDQVMSLSSQLSTNAHVVAAFEQSLSNMTSRLQQLTATAERKDGELTDMRQTIELLRKQSIQAGLTTAHMQSMGVQAGSNQNDLLGKQPPLPPSSGHMMGRTPQHQHHQQQQQQQQQHLQQQPATTNGAGGGGAGTTGMHGAMQRHHSSDSMCSLNSISSGCSAHDKKKKKGWLRSSFTKAFSRNAKISKTSRHVGGGSASSSVVNAGQNNGDHHHHHSAMTTGNIGGGQHHHNGLHIGEGGLASLATQPPAVPASPTKGSPAKTVTLIENAKPIDAIDHEDHHVVEDLKKQLREKDLVLTDIRLEALSSASQLENLKDTVMKMRAEMISLKQNNERLQKLVTSRSLAGSEASLGNAISPNGSIGESRRYSLADGNSRPPMELPKRLEEEVEEENIPPAPAPEPPPPPLSPTTHIDLTPPPPAIEPNPSPAHMSSGVEEIPDITDGKKIAIACYLGQPESFPKYYEEILETDEFYRSTTNGSSGSDGKDLNGGFDERKAFPSAALNEFVIAYTYISGKTTWQNLDYIVRKTFKDYVSRIDPGTNLGLNTDSITSYHLGEAKRGPEMGFPELLPCGYIIGNVRTLYICLQGVGSLAFDSLIPRSIVHRYISLLTEHRRLILCGPSGTGKSYLARRLAEFLVARSGRGNPSEAIATFNVDHKSSKELRQYLGHVAEQASIANGASELPSVIILDNLHHASALGDVFSCLLSAGPAANLPCIIGTMSQATCNTTNLQLHHNFRWVLTANHMEPVKGFLGRFLRRRLFQLELQTQNHQPELSTVLAWLPTVWQHINRFLEIHSSSDVTIGPRLFLSCPLDLKDSQVWFTDIWNYHLSPYLVEAVREGVQLYGRRGGAWNDPSAFIRNSYPWPYGPDSVPPLRQINAEDVGLEGITTSNGDAQDPLLNMLMRLQEAANYSENQDQESDCASLDSNITPDSSAGAE